MNRFWWAKSILSKAQAPKRQMKGHKAYGCRVELTLDQPFFWMNGRLAYDLVEISDDPTCLDSQGFWAVSTTFEGKWICARFAKIEEAPLPPASSPWTQLTNAWESSLSRHQYSTYVEEIRSRIRQGSVYQVNACLQLKTTIDAKLSLLPLMHEMCRENPAPYASFLRLPGLEIASASPELFLRRKDAHITSGPIKGTQKSATDEFGSKDTAENIMIVDLIRNDVGRISKAGSVTVPRLLATEVHPGLSHLVSDVSGQLQDGIGWAHIANALLPPGSVSGAPKISAISIISELEILERGPYCGALGWVQGNEALLSVAIRIFWKADDEFLYFGSGAGITWSSNPENEWDEVQLKASRLISIAGGVLS